MPKSYLTRVGERCNLRHVALRFHDYQLRHLIVAVSSRRAKRKAGKLYTRDINSRQCSFSHSICRFACAFSLLERRLIGDSLKLLLFKRRAFKIFMRLSSLIDELNVQVQVKVNWWFSMSYVLRLLNINKMNYDIRIKLSSNDHKVPFGCKNGMELKPCYLPY